MILPDARVGRMPLRPWPLAQALLRRARADSLLRNSLFIMATTVVTSLLGFIYTILATHIYSKPALGRGVAEFGLGTALVSAMTLASNLSNLGIGPTLVQRLPRRESGRDWSLTLNAGLITGMLCGLVVGLALMVGLPLFSPRFAVLDHNVAYALIFIAGVPLWTASTLLDYVYVAERATGNMLVRNVAFSLLKIPLLGLALVVAHIGALGILASWVLAAAAAVLGGLLLLVPRLGRGYRPALRGFGGQVRSMLTALAGNHFINIGGMAPMYLLPIFVTARISTASNAYFYTTWMLGSLFFMVSPAVASSLFAEGAHAEEGLWHKARSSMLIISALLAPSMLFFLLAGHYVMAVFGPAYPQHGGTLLLLLIISAVPDAITNVYVSVLRVRRRLGDAAVLNLGMAALTLALAWVLLPSMGIAGAGAAWLIAQTAGSVGVAAHIWLTVQRRPAMPPASARDQARTEQTELAPALPSARKDGV